MLDCIKLGKVHGSQHNLILEGQVGRLATCLADWLVTFEKSFLLVILSDSNIQFCYFTTGKRANLGAFAQIQV